MPGSGIWKMVLGMHGKIEERAMVYYPPRTGKKGRNTFSNQGKTLPTL